MSTVGVRYIVNDVDAAIGFYTNALDFEVEVHPAPGFAALKRGDLRLYLNAPGAGGAGQASKSGEAPVPGGWNRFQLIVDDLQQVEQKLADQGATFRTRDVEGKGGLQALVEDPSGNLIELFQPTRKTSA
jgi:catechol 2,3-dioxygenase-like lactoylglutathione lyase family enzyme